jgi:hypothetical protein
MVEPYHPDRRVSPVGRRVCQSGWLVRPSEWYGSFEIRPDGLALLAAPAWKLGDRSGVRRNANCFGDVCARCDTGQVVESGAKNTSATRREQSMTTPVDSLPEGDVHGIDDQADAVPPAMAEGTTWETDLPRIIDAWPTLPPFGRRPSWRWWRREGQQMPNPGRRPDRHQFADVRPRRVVWVE